MDLAGSRKHIYFVYLATSNLIEASNIFAPK